MARRPKTWSRRAPAAPWTDREIAELKAMSRCGLASEFWQVALPGRGFGEIVARRLELREAGELVLAPPL